MILVGAATGLRKPALAHRQGSGALGGGENLRPQPVEIGDSRVALGRERIAWLRQLFERLAHIKDAVAFDQPQPIVVEPADPHPALRPWRTLSRLSADLAAMRRRDEKIP